MAMAEPQHGLRLSIRCTWAGGFVEDKPIWKSRTVTIISLALPEILCMTIHGIYVAEKFDIQITADMLTFCRTLRKLCLQTDDHLHTSSVRR